MCPWQLGRSWPRLVFGIAPAAGLLEAKMAVPCYAYTTLGSSADRGFRDCATSLLGVKWAMSRRRGNRGIHALNGKGPPGIEAQGRATVGRRAPGVQLAREMQDLQPVGKLRSSGWTIPKSVDDSTLVRVNDTRLVASLKISCWLNWVWIPLEPWLLVVIF
jgi:hypothetical protein